MSIIDKFLDVMRLNDDDYEFDNEDYDYDEEEDYEVKEKKPSRRERKKEEEQQQTAATFDISEKQRQKQQRLHAVQQEKRNRQSVRLASRLRLHRQGCMKPLPNRFLRRKPMPLRKVQKQKILHSKPVILHSEKWL